MALLEKLLRVQNALPACLKTILLFSVFVIPSLGQELLTNGDFEAGRLPPWSVAQPPGSLVTLVPENSPFNAVYPGGVSSVKIVDDNEVVDQPSLSQSFTPRSTIEFGFDFKVTALDTQNSWAVAWNGENDTTGFFFLLGGQDGVSISLNQQKIADLTNVWYHIQGWADAPKQTVEGFVVNALGQSAPFQGGFPFGVQNELSAILVSDIDAGQSPDLLLDNFYSRPISLDFSRNSQGEEVLTWLAPNFTLQSARSLDASAAWTNVSSANGAYTNTFSDLMRFFRLTHP